MRIIFTIASLLCCILLSAQDITGTWEGELVTSGSAFEGIQRISKMKWELVQVEKKSVWYNILLPPGYKTD